MIRSLTWSSQCIWVYNNLQITIESMNINTYVDIRFSVVVEKYYEVFHLERNECFEFIAL